MTVQTSVRLLAKSQTLLLPSRCRPTFIISRLRYDFIWLISHRNVIVKLLAFTLAMVVGPIGTYFLTLNTVFKGMLARLERENVTWMMLTWTAGNSTFAGATAAVMANVVLVAYVVIAMRENQSEAIEAAEKEKKAH
jgi:hypothetical protein